jgi:zinc protease
MKKTYTQHSLSNGLNILLKEIHTAPIVSTWMWYRIGSRDEVPGLTGISHWTEHMQFKGTPLFPASVLDKLIAREGGMWNAFTHFDWTTYFESMPADKFELGLRLEADRMKNSKFDASEVEAERTVILSEREGSENDPLFRLGEAVQMAAFRVHSYHHEILGDLADLKTITRDDLFRHYRTYYIPNNAVLAVAGDFDTRVMLKHINDLYASIPEGPEPARLNRSEPAGEGEHRLAVEGPGETTFIEIAYRVPSGKDADFMTLTVLDSLLAGPSSMNMFGGGGISNKTSRLYRALVEKELAVSIHGGLSTTIDPYLYMLTITVHPQRKPEEALAAFDAEIQRIQQERCSESEVARAIKQARANFAFGTESITNQAFWLGHAEMFASYDWFLTFLDRLEKVTPDKVLKAAQIYLQPRNRVVGTYLPTGGPNK